MCHRHPMPRVLDHREPETLGLALSTQPLPAGGIASRGVKEKENERSLQHLLLEAIGFTPQSGTGLGEHIVAEQVAMLTVEARATVVSVVYLGILSPPLPAL